MRFEFTSPTRPLFCFLHQFLSIFLRSLIVYCTYIYLSEQFNTMLKDKMSGLQVKMISIFCLFYSFASQKESPYSEIPTYSSKRKFRFVFVIPFGTFVNKPVYSFLVCNRFQYILFQTISLLTYCVMLLRKNWMILHKSYDTFKFQSCKK